MITSSFDCNQCSGQISMKNLSFEEAYSKNLSARFQILLRTLPF